MIYSAVARLAAIGVSAIAISVLGASPARGFNLVTNGSFETTSDGGPGQLGTPFGTELPGWDYLPATHNYSFIFAPGTADTIGTPSEHGGAHLSFWGSNNGGTDVWPATSPDGGNFLAIDPVYKLNGPISQQIDGLAVGKQYAVSFYEAAAQQLNWHGPTYEQWQVSFGGQTQTGTFFSLPNHGFSGWFKTTLTFTATAASQTLSFLSTGGPVGLPPFTLLDGVSVEEVASTPESSPVLAFGALTLLGAGIALKSKLTP